MSSTNPVTPASPLSMSLDDSVCNIETAKSTDVRVSSTTLAEPESQLLSPTALFNGIYAAKSFPAECLSLSLPQKLPLCHSGFQGNRPSTPSTLLDSNPTHREPVKRRYTLFEEDEPAAEEVGNGGMGKSAYSYEGDSYMTNDKLLLRPNSNILAPFQCFVPCENPTNCRCSSVLEIARESCVYRDDTTQSHISTMQYSNLSPPQCVQTLRITLHSTQHHHHHFISSIQHLKIELKPLVSITTGHAHPWFPLSILKFHLLTHDMLDSLAQWYHQTSEDHMPDANGAILAERYPAPIDIAKVWICKSAESSARLQHAICEVNDTLDRKPELETKRRRFGRFIGLRGCESPVENENVQKRDGEETPVDERMDREWTKMLRHRAEEELAQGKIWKDSL